MQFYTDPKRESDPHALPDLEVWEHSEQECKKGRRHVYAPNEPEAGELDECLGAGWYYWHCFPGCIPDSDAMGPFSTQEEALEDAREGMGEEENPLWLDDKLQFARLIAELEAAGAFTTSVFRDLCESMDLQNADLRELIDRAQGVWDEAKGRV